MKQVYVPNRVYFSMTCISQNGRIGALSEVGIRNGVREVFDLSMSNVLSGIVGLFFIVGAVVNWIARPKIASDYARWGYPTFFHYVTAVIEGIVAVSVLIPSTRILGAILGALVMVAAGATLVRHKEYRQAIAPALFFIACIAVIVVNWNGS